MDLERELEEKFGYLKDNGGVIVNAELAEFIRKREEAIRKQTTLDVLWKIEKFIKTETRVLKKDSQWLEYDKGFNHTLMILKDELNKIKDEIKENK